MEILIKSHSYERPEIELVTLFNEGVCCISGGAPDSDNSEL